MKTIKSGAAFNGNKLMGTRPISGIPGKTVTKYVSLTQWCERNSITKRVGRKLIEKKFLIGVRRKHIWWVCANSYRLEGLKNYLGVEKLMFDADNSDI